MPKFTIETTYDLPVYRHTTYEADTAAAACEMALADDDWELQKEDIESSGPNRITGVWLGEDAAYEGEAVPTPLEPIVATYDGIRAVVQHHFDEASAAVVGNKRDPLLDVAINAAIDILAKALLQLRTEKDAT